MNLRARRSFHFWELAVGFRKKPGIALTNVIRGAGELAVQTVLELGHPIRAVVQSILSEEAQLETEIVHLPDVARIGGKVLDRKSVV
jgi:hypothetical protein